MYVRDRGEQRSDPITQLDMGGDTHGCITEHEAPHEVGPRGRGYSRHPPAD